MRFNGSNNVSKGSGSKADMSIHAPQSCAAIQQNRPFATKERRGSKTQVESLPMRDAIGFPP